MSVLSEYGTFLEGIPSTLHNSKVDECEIPTEHDLIQEL